MSNNEIQTQDNGKEISLANQSTMEIMMNPSAMAVLENMADKLAGGKITVPAHLRGNPADCMAICLQAAQWGMNPFAVAQKTHLVNGHLGYEAQLVNAVIESSKAIKGGFKYEFSWKDGANNGLVRAGAILRNEDQITWGEWIDTSKITTKNSPLWKTAPKQQAAYLAVKYWARLFAPSVMLGVYTTDEWADAPQSSPRGKRINDAPSNISEIMEKEVAADEAADEGDYAEYSEGEPKEDINEITGEVTNLFDHYSNRISLADKPALKLIASELREETGLQKDQIAMLREAFIARMDNV